MGIGIGILGGGTVGGALVRRLVDNRDVIAAKTGLQLEVLRVGVRTLDKERGFDLLPGVLTDNVADVVADDSVEMLVEVMGGMDPAGDLVLAALRAGKPVVTANKELIAARGPELFQTAEEAGVSLLFEAAVGGGIPIIRPLWETLAGETLTKVMGIVNGTTNFILTAMSESGMAYKVALAEAQRLGYAETDPSSDVTGVDAAAKAAILAGLAFGSWVGADAVYREGITGLDPVDLQFAAELGYVVKLLAVAERTEEGVNARVYPAMVLTHHPLASVRGARNAISIEGPAVQRLLFSGPGAGGEPTASAVLGDIITAARELRAGTLVAPRIRLADGGVADFGDVSTMWYLRLMVVDQPGVLAQIAAVFGHHGVSIRSVRQECSGDEATLLIVTHSAPERAQQAARDGLRGLGVVSNVAAAIRVESTES